MTLVRNRPFANAARNTVRDEQRSEFFANLGFETTDPTTGETMFIQLEGVTVTFDRLATRRAYGQNALFNAGVEKVNRWTNGVKAIMDALDAGETSPTLKVQLQVRKARPIEEPVPTSLEMQVDDPDLAAALEAMRAKKAAPEPVSEDPADPVDQAPEIESEGDDEDLPF